MYSMQGMVWYGMAWHGMVWHGMAWHGMVWHCNDMAWHGMITNTACYNYGIVQKKFDIVEYMAWVSLLSYPSKWNKIYGTIVGLLLTRISRSSRGGKSFSGRNWTCPKSYPVLLSLSLSLFFSLSLYGWSIRNSVLFFSLWTLSVLSKNLIGYTTQIILLFFFEMQVLYALHYSNWNRDPATHLIMRRSDRWRSFFSIPPLLCVVVVIFIAVIHIIIIVIVILSKIIHTFNLYQCDIHCYYYYYYYHH